MLRFSKLQVAQARDPVWCPRGLSNEDPEGIDPDVAHGVSRAEAGIALLVHSHYGFTSACRALINP